MEFKPFPKLARLNRDIVVTEKLDGTNAQAVILETRLDAFQNEYEHAIAKRAITDASGFLQHWQLMFAGSRTRWITPEADNFGFAKWVKENAEELFQLGPGQHFGEWWGGKIQRGYGLTEKRFSLFNTGRWVERYAELSAVHDEGASILREGQQMAPACCHVVPVLYQGKFSDEMIGNALETLRERGSFASPGFSRPEGIVIYHTAANSMFKVTLENDAQPKSLVWAA